MQIYGVMEFKNIISEEIVLLQKYEECLEL